MTRRSTDGLRQQIEDRERLLADCARTGNSGLAIFVERELTRLRADLAYEERPERHGRRAADHEAAPLEALAEASKPPAAR